MADGLVFDIATKIERSVPLTLREAVEADLRRDEAMLERARQEQREQQRQSDLQALKTAEIAQLRVILARLFDA